MNAFPSTNCAVIIVTHNSQKYLTNCLQALKEQTQLPLQIIIVDSGSQETTYLQSLAQDPLITLHQETKNIGFCQANNIGMRFVLPATEYVLFLNPDAFLSAPFLEQATTYMSQPQATQIGALSGILLGYNIHNQQPTGKIDSTGIFQTWYGRWYDRAQGINYIEQQNQLEEKVPALCGALLFCRLRALESVQLDTHVIMDPTFYMYKEDIDLSLRLRKKGWHLYFFPQLVAYHCRGWQNRANISRDLRLLSAKNEMRLHARLKSPFYCYSLLKFLAVKFFNR